MSKSMRTNVFYFEEMVGVRMGFTHLQVRSAYSLLNSSIKLADYVSLATLNQFKSLALVEEGSMHSAIKFYIACQKAGIKPIIGMSLKIRGEGFEDEWTLLAKNNKGYEIRFRDCGKSDYIQLDTYEDFWTYLNELYQFNSVTEIRVFIEGKEDNYWDYIG